MDEIDAQALLAVVLELALKSLGRERVLQILEELLPTTVSQPLASHRKRWADMVDDDLWAVEG